MIQRINHFAKTPLMRLTVVLASAAVISGPATGQPLQPPGQAAEKSAEEIAQDRTYFAELGLTEDGLSDTARHCGSELGPALLAYRVPVRISNTADDTVLQSTLDFFWRGHLRLADALAEQGCAAAARQLYEKALKNSAGANQIQFIEWAKYGLDRLDER